MEHKQVWFVFSMDKNLHEEFDLYNTIRIFLDSLTKQLFIRF